MSTARKLENFPGSDDQKMVVRPLAELIYQYIPEAVGQEVRHTRAEAGRLRVVETGQERYMALTNYLETTSLKSNDPSEAARQKAVDILKGENENLKSELLAIFRSQELPGPDQDKTKLKTALRFAKHNIPEIALAYYQALHQEF